MFRLHFACCWLAVVCRVFIVVVARRYVLFDGRWLFIVVYSLSFDVCGCSLVVVCRLLFVFVCGLWFVVCCLLYVCCVLFVLCCLLLYVVCLFVVVSCLSLVRR